MRKVWIFLNTPAEMDHADYAMSFLVILKLFVVLSVVR